MAVVLNTDCNVFEKILLLMGKILLVACIIKETEIGSGFCSHCVNPRAFLEHLWKDRTVVCIAVHFWAFETCLCCLGLSAHPLMQTLGIAGQYLKTCFPDVTVF